LRQRQGAEQQCDHRYSAFERLHQYLSLFQAVAGFYLCDAAINATNSDAFCAYSSDNARVMGFKLSAEFCHLRRRYAR
jgi:hypothetical protein